MKENPAITPECDRWSREAAETGTGRLTKNNQPSRKEAPAKRRSAMGDNHTTSSGRLEGATASDVRHFTSGDQQSKLKFGRIHSDRLDFSNRAREESLSPWCYSHQWSIRTGELDQSQEVELLYFKQNRMKKLWATPSGDTDDHWLVRASMRHPRPRDIWSVLWFCRSTLSNERGYRLAETEIDQRFRRAKSRFRQSGTWICLSTGGRN